MISMCATRLPVPTHWIWEDMLDAICGAGGPVHLSGTPGLTHTIEEGSCHYIYIIVFDWFPEFLPSYLDMFSSSRLKLKDRNRMQSKYKTTDRNERAAGWYTKTWEAVQNVLFLMHLIITDYMCILICAMLYYKTFSYACVLANCHRRKHSFRYKPGLYGGGMVIYTTHRQKQFLIPSSKRINVKWCFMPKMQTQQFFLHIWMERKNICSIFK